MIVKKYIISEREDLINLIRDYMVCLRAIVIGDSKIKFKSFEDVLPKLKMDNKLITGNNTIDVNNFNNIFELNDISDEEISIVEKEVPTSIDYFNTHHPLDAYRGKELINIAYDLLCKAKGKFHKKSGLINSKLGFSKQLKEEDFISDFSSYTEEPLGLRVFIDNFRNEYI